MELYPAIDIRAGRVVLGSPVAVEPGALAAPADQLAEETLACCSSS